jgi:pectinesterase
LLKPGIYREKIKIQIDNITLIGEDKNTTIIENKDYYHKIMEDYNECNTFRTYTVFVGANNITIKNLTIRNTSVPSDVYGQAVALHADGNNFKCENVFLDSAQDTLFTAPLPPNLLIKYKGFLPDYEITGNHNRQIYDKCTIRGDVDFIFGGATALFNECEIISLNRNVNHHEAVGYISAPSHNPDIPYGYLFYKCNIKADSNVQNVYLSRPWRDYGCAAFIECNIGNHILPSGFSNWNNTSRYETARYAEYSPNIDTSNRAKWAKMLSKEEAYNYYNNFMKYLKEEA